jgi:predicted nucleic acid-binding protein
MLPVFLDTCVLLRPYLCDTLLSVAEAGVYRPLWSPMVMTELERNLGRRGLNEKQIRHRLDQMNGAFPDALVVGYEALIDQMVNDPKDRHVLAAAARGGAEVLVTENLRDFPAQAVHPYNIEVVNQDTFCSMRSISARPTCWPPFGVKSPGTTASRGLLGPGWPFWAARPQAARDSAKCAVCRFD